MPGTLRYKSEFDSKYLGVEWEVYIDDTTWLINPFTFKTRNGFNLDYPIQAKDSPRESYILPSTLTFDFLNEDGGADTLQSNIIAANEERFKVKIVKDGALFWSGFILTDQVAIADAPKPASFFIKAVDGLGRLKDIPYNDSGARYTGRATLLEHIQNCFDKIPFSYFHDTNDIFLRTAMNWYEVNHITTVDPLANTDVDHSVFYKIDDKGNYTYDNCYQVLEEILKVAGCRLLQTDGCFVIEQVNERADIPYTQFNYRKDFTQISSSNSAQYELEINTTLIERPHRLSGGIFTFYPPLDSVCVDYEHDTAKNLLTGTNFANKWPEGSRVGLGELDTDSAGERLLISFNINYDSTWVDVPNFEYYRHLLRLQIKVGNYYLKRTFNVNNNNITYGPVEWTTTPEYYEISTNYLYKEGSTPDETTIDGVLNVSFETPELVEGGDIEINLFYVGTWTYDNTQLGTQPFGLIYAFYWSMTDKVLRVLAEGDQSGIETSRQYCATNSDSDKNTQKLQLKIKFGDGPFVTTFNKLKVYDGSDWLDSEEWKVDATGTGYNIQQLLIRQILAGQKLPIERYEGDISGDFTARTRLEWDSTFYLFEGGTLDAKYDTWSGRWFKIAVDDTNITNEQPTVLEVPQEIPTGPDTDTPQPDGPGTDDQPVVDILLETRGDNTIDDGFYDFTTNVIDLSTPLDQVYQAGDQITIINPNNGNTAIVTVLQNTEIGDNTIVVSGDITGEFPPGSSIVSSQPTIFSLFVPGDVPAPYKICIPYTNTENYSDFVTFSTLTVSVADWFWVVPRRYDGWTLVNFTFSVATAGSGGSTNWSLQRNGSSAVTGSLASGSKTSNTTASITISEGDTLALVISAVSSTAPAGLAIDIEMTSTENLYIENFIYNFPNIVEAENIIRYQFVRESARKIAASILFDGTNYVDLGNTQITGYVDRLQTDFTISVWLYFDDEVNDTGTILSWFDGTDGWRLYKTTSSIIFAVGSTVDATIAVSDLSAQTWHHVTVKYIAGASAQMFLDGIAGTVETYGSITYVATNLEIAGYDDGNDMFTGYMSMLRLYSRALTESEILNNKNVTYEDLNTTIRGALLNSWELYDKVDDTLPDSAGDYPGTIT